MKSKNRIEINVKTIVKPRKLHIKTRFVTCFSAMNYRPLIAAPYAIAAADPHIATALAIQRTRPLRKSLDGRYGGIAPVRSPAGAAGHRTVATPRRLHPTIYRSRRNRWMEPTVTIAPRYHTNPPPSIWFPNPPFRLGGGYSDRRPVLTRSPDPTARIAPPFLNAIASNSSRSAILTLE